MTSTTVFDWHSVPYGWALCLHAGCPLSAQCLRHLAAQHVPSGTMTATCVIPSPSSDNGCKAYCSAQPVRMAYGFTNLLSALQRHEATALRRQLRRYLGTGGTYYRYLNGIMPLTPEQQQHIRRMTACTAHCEAAPFDHYAYSYHFAPMRQNN